MSSIINEATGPHTTAVYGDPESANATVVRSLPTDDGSINVITNSSQLGLYQTLTLNDNIYDTRTEIVDSTNLNVNTDVIQGVLMGWTNKQDMVIGIKCQILCEVVNSLGAPDNMGGISDWIQPEFAILLPINRIEIKLGFNNQIVQRNMMNYKPGLTMIAMDTTYSYAQSMAAAELGLPYSKGVTSYSNQVFAFPAGTFMACYKEIDRAYESRWNQIWSSVYKDGTGSGFPQDLEFGLPLRMINSFFREDAFLPAGLPFRIEIECTFGPNIFAYQQAIGISAGTGSLLSVAYYHTYNLMYRTHLLRPQIQDDINNQWIEKPLLYQYDVYEFVELPGDGNTTVFVKDIAINQQRPTQLFFRVINVDTNAGGTPLRLGTIPTVGLASPYRYLVAFANSTANMIRYGYIQIYIDGKLGYYLRMDPTQNVTGSFPSTSAGILNTLVNGRTYDDIGYKHLTDYSQPENFFQGKPFCVTINPGDFVKRGYISADAGPVVIRVQVQVLPLWNPVATTGIPNTLKLVIYKKYPEQIQINAAKNLNIIQWPAVATSSDYLIPSTTNVN